MRRLGSVTVDTRPLRESRDFRLLMLGAFVTGLGAQAGLVALPYQTFVTTRSPVLVGLLGAVELGPLVTASLLGGALADRLDRRTLLIVVQLALVIVAAVLAVGALLGSPPVWFLYLLAAASAGASGIERVVRAAIVPNVVAPRRLRSALAFSFGSFQLTMVIGPALGGAMIASLGIASAYLFDAATCAAMAAAAWAMAPQRPSRSHGHAPIVRAIGSGLRFVRAQPAVLGSFAIDLVAMTFGMPRALFPVLSLTVYHAGAAGTGLLYAAVAAGATIAALTTGWLERARFLGRIVIGAVLAWGVAIALAGLVGGLLLAALLFALAGAADSVSAVCRSTIAQSLTPDEMRGRVSSVFSLVVASGPRLGDVEAGTVASLTSVRTSVVSGGLACIAGVGVILLAFPALAAYDGNAIRAPGVTPDPVGAAAP
ncbi:MAG TPA: MFS transporter [Solirubrobacteraceae bacterium]|jgi:MFS family permease|nr:MFS transporter [Solirubrobacteraceae bacterium]